MQQVSFTGKRWTVPTIRMEENFAEALTRLKSQRAIGDDRWGWRDPDTYAGARDAAKRLLRAIEKEETIGIVGDYDCDGMTSAAIVIRILQRRNVEPVVHLPNRQSEGYGLKSAHVDALARKGVTLLITTDTGIVAREALENAAEKGMDVIVIDHHTFTELPKAFAILHPSLSTMGCMPAAAGVALTFAHAVEGEDWEGRDTDIALAMIGTIADVVPLTQENRTLVTEGLRILSSLPATSPLTMLKAQCGIKGNVTSTDVAFRIAPRLNAAGRMDDPTIGLRALLGDGDAVSFLGDLNALRQRETQEGMKEAMAGIRVDALPHFLCIASKTFQKGTVGLLAGKLSERFGRPALVAAIGTDGICAASLRSIRGYDVTEALRRNSPLFLSLGGHAQAAGCTFRVEMLDTIANALDADATSVIPEENLRPTIHIDVAANIAHASLDVVDSLSTLEPFGEGNREPIFLIENLSLSNVRSVGNGALHLQARAGDVQIIGFNMANLCSELQQNVDIACRITRNEWNGRSLAQLSLVDVRAAQTGANLPSISKTAITGTASAAAIL